MDVCKFGDDIWTLIRLSSICVEQSFRPITEEHGLTLLQLKILAELSRHHPITVSSLAERTHLTNGNTSSMCKKLEKSGFLLRQRDPNDERCVNLVITPEGKRVFHDIQDQISQRYCHILKRYTPAELEQIESSLSLLSTLVGELYEGSRLEGGEL